MQVCRWEMREAVLPPCRREATPTPAWEPQGGREGAGTHLRVFSFLSRDLACCSLMMVAFTWGGFMCTFSFPPTSRRTVAANLVWVFRTCGGCFSMMNVLQVTQGQA